MAELPQGTKPGVAGEGTKVVIRESRYLAGHFDPETGEYIVTKGEDPHYVSAAPEFPATLVLHDGHRIDTRMEVLSQGEKAKASELKKHYAQGGDAPMGKVQTAAEVQGKADKAGKRTSDKSPL